MKLLKAIGSIVLYALAILGFMACVGGIISYAESRKAEQRQLEREERALCTHVQANTLVQWEPPGRGWMSAIALDRVGLDRWRIMPKGYFAAIPVPCEQIR